MKTIAIAGTFDTKGTEFLYVKSLVEQLGFKPFMIHTGVFEPDFEVDITNKDIAQHAGSDIADIVRKKDRAFATEILSKGMEILVPKLYAAGEFDGILSFGGSGGTSLVTPAMRALPIGVPKVMVSTMASGNVAQYVGASDIVMIPSIVDVAGLNKISKTIFRNAILTIAGMVGLKDQLKGDLEQNKPLIAATMFGVTTPCVNYAKNYLEQRGYEVLIFHATGTGGRTMDSLISTGFFKGVLDLTTTEWCDEIVGGVLNAGPNRCEAAAKHGVPQVMSVGALDMVNFGPFDTIPNCFKDRLFYRHNPMVTLMRTTEQEIMAKFRNEVANGKILVGVGAGTGITAKCSEKGGADMLIIYNSGRFRMAGRGSLSGLLAYGDANKIVQEMGAEVLPIVKDTPVLAGVCGTDPFRVMDLFLKQLKEQGFNGVQNFPTVGLIDGKFRANLEETGMGYGLEVEMIREAHKLDMLTCPYVFDAEQAAAMAEAGADILVAHLGLTTKGSIGAETALTLDDCCEIIREIISAGRKVNPEILVICHGGPIADPEDAEYVIKKVPEIDGFFGASSIERLASERGMTTQTAAFKAIKK